MKNNELNLELFGEYSAGELKSLEDALQHGEKKFQESYDRVNNKESSIYNNDIKPNTKSVTIYA